MSVLIFSCPAGPPSDDILIAERIGFEGCLFGELLRLLEALGGGYQENVNCKWNEEEKEEKSETAQRQLKKCLTAISQAKDNVTRVGRCCGAQNVRCGEWMDDLVGTAKERVPSIETHDSRYMARRRELVVYLYMINCRGHGIPARKEALTRTNAATISLTTVL